MSGAPTDSRGSAHKRWGYSSYRYTVPPARYFGGMYGTSKYESYFPPEWMT